MEYRYQRDWGFDVRILHTSDLHLSHEKRETLQALEQLLDTAESLQVDLLTFGGDLFDTERDADALRPQLRDAFHGNKYDIVAIPGNHDSQAYSRNLDFGSDLKIATDLPFSTFTFGNVSLVAVPYRDKPDDSLIAALRNTAKESETNILLLHCTLDMGFSFGEFGDEQARNYFPIAQATLSRLGYDFILAGHFHARSCHRYLEGGCHFLYPGSPVSLSEKETGKRQCFLVDTSTETVESIPLNTFYYDDLIVDVMPGQEEQKLEGIREWISKRSGDRCSLEVKVNGFIEVSETAFGEALSELEASNVEIRREYKDVQHVLSHPLFRRFKGKLEADSSIQQKGKVEAIVLEAMSQLLAQRGIRA